MHPDHDLEQFYTQSHLPSVPRPFHQLEPHERIDWAKRMEKAQFEAWAKLHHYDLVRCSHEPYAAYRSDLTNAALAGWRGANGEAPQTTVKGDERDLLNAWYEASATGKIQVSDEVYRIVTETAVLLDRAAVPQAGATLTDEQREAVEHCLAWLDPATEGDHITSLRALLAAHNGGGE